MLKNTTEGKTGFTLAEVLITLAIIGVVAAMTIPTLMANYQKTQYVAGLKKAYAEATEALKLMANDHGCSDNLKATSLFIGDGSGNAVIANNLLGNEFKKYFKLAKDCGTTYNAGDDSTKCLSDSYSYNYDGSGDRHDMNSDWNGNYNFITADGFSISINSYDCNTDWTGGLPNLDENQACGTMEIDVNGLKGPNNVGRDIFEFNITNGKGPALYPSGGSNDYDEGPWIDASGVKQSCYDDTPLGWTCAGRIMEEGWQMKY